MEDENIIWKEIRAASFSNEQKEQAVVEPCKMGSFPSLYVELKEKCNPQNYMSPYNKEKVDMANRLYKELLNTPKEDKLSICQLRDKAMQELGIMISTQKVYQDLIEYCDPQSFVNPYDFEAVQLANHYYPLVEEFRNDIHVLEKLHKDIFQDELLKAYYKKKEEEYEKKLKIQEKERLEYEEENRAEERRVKKIIITIVVVIIVFYFITTIFNI